MGYSSRPEHDDWTNLADGSFHPEEPAGATYLMQQLVREYEAQDQHMSIVALDALFSAGVES